MTISRKELLESLKRAMPAIETGTPTLQGADSFVFHDGKIFSYNDSIAVYIPLAITGLVDEGIEGAVHADEFFKVISKFSADEINFAVTGNNTWMLKCGKAKVEVTLMDFDFTTRLQGVTPDENAWVKISDEFVNGIGACKMAVNKTPLAGIYIKGKTIVSTDGYQINKFEMKDTDLPTLWISDNSANELLKLSGLVEMQLQGTWAHFKSSDGTVFSIKTLQAEKFPFDRIVALLDTSKPKEDDFHASFPMELFGAIDRADSFAIDISEHSAVRLVLSNQNIEVSAERTSGKYSEKVAWGEGVEFKETIEPMTVYVDATMMSFMAKRSLEFYLQKFTAKNGKTIPRLLFVSDSSCHLMTTFTMGD